MSKDPNKPVFIFDTYGDWQATKFGDFLFSTRGEYLAYLEDGEVYKRDGEWAHLTQTHRTPPHAASQSTVRAAEAG